MAGGNQLKIKYGLGRDPSDVQIAQWAAIVRQLIREGRDRESAGSLAAQRAFPDYRTHVYASEGDNIDSLLRLAEGKE